MARRYGKGAAIDEVEEYLRNHKEIAERNRLIHGEAERLVSAYRSVLEAKEVRQARMSCWGCETLEEYRDRFLYILTSAYNVWDESHKRYPKLLEAIWDLNPEWLRSFGVTHEQKLKAARVAMYPIS